MYCLARSLRIAVLRAPIETSRLFRCCFGSNTKIVATALGVCHSRHMAPAAAVGAGTIVQFAGAVVGMTVTGEEAEAVAEAEAGAAAAAVVVAAATCQTGGLCNRRPPSCFRKRVPS